MNHKKQGFRFEKDWKKETLRRIKEYEDWKIAITLPVNVSINAKHKVINLDQALNHLDGAENIYKLDCICRTRMGNCDSPIETCIAWDSAKKLLDTDLYKTQNTRLITKEEAIETLKVSHEAGLVHMAYAAWDDEVNRICSCCSCCCAVFSSILRFGMFPDLLSSDTVSVTDLNMCENCGTCVDRCQFGAREMHDQTLTVNTNLCYGCGLCVSTCPTGAITLVEAQ
jgi:ferredoxin